MSTATAFCSRFVAVFVALLLAISPTPACNGAGSGEGPDLRLAQAEVDLALGTVKDLRTYLEANGMEATLSKALEAPLTDLRASIAAALAEGRTTADVREAMAAFDAASRPFLASADPHVGAFVVIARGTVNMVALYMRAARLDDPPVLETSEPLPLESHP